MPRVSVIIPSYNHEKYVAEAIQSVLDQTYQDFEIVITDDGSSDNTVAVIKNFTDSRIRLFCFPNNRGACVAANHCIKESKGEFIALLNSDDAFVNNKLEKQVKFLDEHLEIGAVFSQVQFINENSNNISHIEHFYKNAFVQLNRSRFEWLNYFFFHGNCLCHPSILIRRECYEKVGVYDRRFAQLPDFDFWIRLCQRYEIFILSEQLVKFRIRENQANVSSEKPESQIRMAVEFPQVFQQFLGREVLDNIIKIFPEISNFSCNEKSTLNRESAILCIAKLALESQLPAVNYFGLDALYKLLSSDENLIEKIRKENSFDFTDLIIIAGTKKIFIDPSTEAFFQYSKLWKVWQSWLRIKHHFQKIIRIEKA
jgi:glycosyltransferase involved in cell wall biosynthesis